MNRLKAIIGLSVLCALAVSAFSAASASAAGGTTFGECTEKAPAVKEYQDAHCDVKGPPNNFGHILFPVGEEVKVTATNSATSVSAPFILMGKIAGIFVEIEAKKVNATGSVKNVAGNPMTVTFGTASTEFLETAVLTQEGKCSVVVAKTNSTQTDPMTLGVSTEEKVEPTPAGAKVKVEKEGSGTDMGLKFTPKEENFTTLTFSGASCPAAFTTKPVPVKGFAYAKPPANFTSAIKGSGAEVKFTKASTLGGLTVGGNPATLEGSLTFKVPSGNALISTTE